LRSNPPRRIALVSLLVSFVAAILIFAPEPLGIDGFDGGFAMSFANLLIAIIAAIVAVLYFNMASRLDRMLRGEGVLAHWTYSPEYWNEYTQKEYVEEKAEKKGIFLIVTGFALFFGFLFWAFDSEAGFVVFLIMLGLIGLIAFVCQFSAHYNYKRNIGGVREAYISRDGIYMNRRLTTWRIPFTSFNEVTLEDNHGLWLLSFRYTVTNSRTGPQTYTARVPIPPGEEKTAQNIINQINQQQ
jgi:hypothetical protein